MSKMDLLSPLDAAFLHLDDSNAALHMASVAVFDGPEPRPSELRSIIEDALPRLTHYRQMPVRVPFDLVPPHWQDDPRFALGRHVHRVRVPAPGRRTQLDDAAARVLSLRLPADRPLWDCWIVDGLAGGRWALIGKLHHCMADGIAGTDLLTTILEEDPGRSAHRRGAAAQPPGDRADKSLPGRIARLVAPVHALPRVLELLVPVRRSVLTGPIGAERSYATANVPMREVRAVRETFGVTVNDVVLAAVTGAFRTLLLSRGEEPDPAAVRTLVPVSLRPPEHAGRTDNEISAVVARLPVDVEDPVERLRAVQREIDGLKRSGEAEVAGLLLKAAGLLPPPTTGAVLETLARFPQQVVSTVTTNVPGPRRPLQLGGRRLRALYPYVPIADQLRTGVAVLSYVDTLYVGVTGDVDTVPDVRPLASGIRAAVRELVVAASS